jgi:glucose-6-phosphate 1-epimerase
MVELKSFENGFKYLEVVNAVSSAKIALQGAHIFEYKRGAKEDILWLSDTTAFEEGVAIRGGVPVCWPAFGMNNPSLAQHGFSRTSIFEFVSSQELSENATEVVLSLTHSDESLNLWNYKFDLEFKVRVSESLVMELKTTNRDTKEFTLTQALHSYFRVSDISNAVVLGLKNKPRLDALRDEIFTQKEDVKFSEEFDSVFQKVKNEIILKDKERKVSIKNEGSSSVVVWNPWIEKGSRMSSMRADAYREFLCIESANAYEDFRVLKPSESHTLKTILH